MPHSTFACFLAVYLSWIRAAAFGELYFELAWPISTTRKSLYFSDFLVVLISVGLAQAHSTYMYKICINIHVHVNVHVAKLIVIKVLQLYDISFHNCSIVHTSRL